MFAAPWHCPGASHISRDRSPAQSCGGVPEGEEKAAPHSTGKSVGLSVLGSKHPSDSLPPPQHPNPGCPALPLDGCKGFPGAERCHRRFWGPRSAPAPTHSCGSRHQPLTPCPVYGLWWQSPALCPSPWDTAQRPPARPAVARGAGTLAYMFFPGAGRLLPAVLLADKAGSCTVQAKGCQQCLPGARQVLARCLPHQGQSADGCRTALSPSPGPAPVPPALQPGAPTPA